MKKPSQKLAWACFIVKKFEIKRVKKGTRQKGLVTSVTRIIGMIRVRHTQPYPNVMLKLRDVMLRFAEITSLF